MLLNRLSRANRLFLANRNFSTLVLAEHLDGHVNSSLGSSLRAASELNDDHVSSPNVNDKN